MRKHVPCAFLLLLLASATARAGVITIPWTLDFSFVPDDQTRVASWAPGGGVVALQNFEVNHEISHTIRDKVEAPIVGTDLMSIDVRTGLRFPAQAQTAFTLRLPFEITLTAPDRARAGQNVFIGASIQLADDAYFSARGRIGFQTEAFLQGSASLGPFDGGIDINVPLPDGVSYGGSGLRLGGSESYAQRDDSAIAVAAGPFARQNAIDGQVFTTPQQRFEGQQFQTEGRVDAQRGALDLLDLLQSVPALGAIVAPVNAVLDLELRAGVDLTERSTLSTGALYALYTEYGGVGERKTALLNSLGSDGFSITVPQDAGDRYAIDVYGLGLGFGLQREMLLTPEMELVLDAIWPFGEWRLLGGDLGDSWLLGRQYSRFQFEEYFSILDYPRYIPPEQRLLSFVLGTDAPPAPPIVIPELPMAPEDFAPLGDPFTTANLPGTAPTVGGVQYVAVPEPGTWALLGMVLPVMAIVRRRRRQPHPDR